VNVNHWFTHWTLPTGLHGERWPLVYMVSGNHWVTRWVLTGLNGERSFNFKLWPMERLNRRVADVSVTQPQRLVAQHADHYCQASGQWSHSRDVFILFSLILLAVRFFFVFHLVCLLSSHCLPLSLTLYLPFSFFHSASFPFFHVFLLLLAFLLVSTFPLSTITSSFPPCLRRSAVRQYVAGVWKTDRKMVCKSLPLARHAGEESSDSLAIFRSRLSL
jgi:hypothetical protein